MARKEPRVIPQLRLAREYPKYVDYMLFHRHVLEQMPAFARWDKRLQKLIDSEGRSLGINLQDSRAWDDLYVHIAVPIRTSFWWGWENCWRLQDLHAKWIEWMKIHQPKKNAERQILHVFMSDLKRQVEGEKDMWEAITNRLFEQQDGTGEDDESFWTLPSAQSIGAKG